MSRSSCACSLRLVVLASSSGALVAQTPSATPPPAVVDVPPDPPLVALSGARPVREVRGLREGDDVMNVRYPVVALDDAAAAADLDLRMRAEVGRAVWGALGASHGRFRVGDVRPRHGERTRLIGAAGVHGDYVPAR